MPALLDRRFEAIVFDWDGTAVTDRAADTTALRSVIEQLCELGMELAVITGTHVGNVDGQLGARPRGPGRLHLCVNRGSEVFRVDEDGLHLRHRREATPEEEAALDAAARLTVERLAARGVRAAIVSQRLNRRKVDLIPEPEWADPPKARIGELLDAVEERLSAAGLGGLAEAVALAEESAREAGVAVPCVTSDAKHVEIGLTDKADSASWVFKDLWIHGIGPRLVLVAGDEFGPLGGLPGSDSFLLVPEAEHATAVSVGVEPTGVPSEVLHLGGGPAAFLDVLEDQRDRRLGGDVPEVESDPVWSLTIDGIDPELERVHEALLTVADGRLGTNGSPAGSHPSAAPCVLTAGVYDGDGAATGLLEAPAWARLDFEVPVDPLFRRRLDLHTGLLRQELALHEGALVTLQWSSLARPGTAVFRAQGPGARLRSGAPLVAVDGAVEAGGNSRRRWIRARASSGGITAAAADRHPGPGRLDRLAAYAGDAAAVPEPEIALAALREAEQRGFEDLLTEHRRAWASRWEAADVVIDGDPELQFATRFALYHLMASVTDEGEAAVGARGLSGPAYRGHVFWDSDVFVLPFLAATHPSAARAMLEYRVRRLAAARKAARDIGRAGARFAWESAGDGRDVTPSHARDHAGRIVRIRTGELEDHVVADVAWAAACYVDWTGDELFRRGPGLELLVETARYWASRLRYGGDGRAHIYGVIGPDEYHEPVDDNAFTNVMARWNLRRAAAEAAGSVDEDERGRWLHAAEALTDGYDPETGIYEQFAGFYRLEPLVIAEFSPRRPIAADLLLGRERTAKAQVLKQADVLMLHHLVPDEVAPRSLTPNLDFYEPRTAHGSSLSPAIHASLLARAGRLDDAVGWLRLAGGIDLNDVTGTTAGGLHLATMGGLWQALAYGFAGIRVRGDVLTISPRRPPEWRALEVRVRFRGTPAVIRIDDGGVSVSSGAPLNWEVEET